jgi:CBS domain containing-hemolysin-like protein
VHASLDAYLSACQLGITLASLGLGWIGEPAFAQVLQPVFLAVGIDSVELLHAVAFAVAFSIISYLHIVIGELAPKSMAIRLSDAVGLWAAAPLYAFYWLMYPAIWFLNTSSNWVLRKVGLDVASEHESHYSDEELKLIVRRSRADASSGDDAWRVLAHALDFRDLEVADLMRPFDEAVTLSEADAGDAILDRIAQHRYSRYPYIARDGSLLGVVHVKDLLVHRGETAAQLREIARPIDVVPPNMPAIELFRRFRKGAPHFALVGNDAREPLGFVTLDNLLGALVGEIRDEFRQTDNTWSRLDDGSLVGQGSLPIYTLERVLGVEITDTDVDSVGGLVYQRLRDIPHEGQRVPFDGFDIVVTHMKGPRILGVRVYPNEGGADA